jgi:hypothetical protein
VRGMLLAGVVQVWVGLCSKVEVNPVSYVWGLHLMWGPVMHRSSCDVRCVVRLAFLLPVSGSVALDPDVRVVLDRRCWRIEN